MLLNLLKLLQVSTHLSGVEIPQPLFTQSELIRVGIVAPLKRNLLLEEGQKGPRVAVAAGRLSADVGRRTPLHVLVRQVGHLHHFGAADADAGADAAPALALDLLVDRVGLRLDLHVRVVPGRVGAVLRRRSKRSRRRARIAGGRVAAVSGFAFGGDELVHFGEVGPLAVDGLAVRLAAPRGARRVLLLGPAVARVPREGLVRGVLVSRRGRRMRGCGCAGRRRVAARQRLVEAAHGERVRRGARPHLPQGSPRAHDGCGPRGEWGRRGRRTHVPLQTAHMAQRGQELKRRERERALLEGVRSGRFGSQC